MTLYATYITLSTYITYIGYLFFFFILKNLKHCLNLRQPKTTHIKNNNKPKQHTQPNLSYDLQTHTPYTQDLQT